MIWNPPTNYALDEVVGKARNTEDTAYRRGLKLNFEVWICA